MFQDAMRRGRGFMPCNKHEPEAFSEFVLVPAHTMATGLIQERGFTYEKL